MDVLTYGNPGADLYLVQMADDHDLEVLESELAYIRELSGDRDFCMKAVKTDSWNLDLSPWQAPAVFGNEDFGEGAGGTLKFLLEEVLSDLSVREKAAVGEAAAPGSGKKIYLGGYSLAGLFALWAGYQTDRFDGIAAASPSIWFPAFTDYMRSRPMLADAVYLSLGDREERTKNPVMSRVGSAIREAESILTEAGTDCILEWNKGNHFKQADLRTARAFAWLMGRK